jgi:hypothetical protein
LDSKRRLVPPLGQAPRPGLIRKVEAYGHVIVVVILSLGGGYYGYNRYGGPGIGGALGLVWWFVFSFG